MKKFLKIAVLAVILAISCIGLIACNSGDPAGAEKGLVYKVLTGDDYYTVTGYVQEDGKTTLDLGDYNKDGVTIGRIMPGAFDGNAKLTEIIVPDTVVKIDQGAFKGMQKLEKITLPFIGETANSDPTYNNSSSDDKSIDMERTFGYIFGKEEYNYSIKLTQKYNEAETSVQDYYVPMTLTEVTVKPKVGSNYSIPMNAFSGNRLVKTVVLTADVVESANTLLKTAWLWNP